MDESKLKQLRADSVAIQVKAAALEYEKMAGHVLSEFGLTPSQYKVLKVVLTQPEGTVRQVDIERAFSMTNPTVTGIVQNLEKNGLVQRVENPNDARSKVIVPTARTLEMKDALFEAGREIERAFTRRITEAERKRLLALLDKLLGA